MMQVAPCPGITCPGRGHYQKPTAAGSTRKVGIVGGAPEPPGPAGTAGDPHVLTHAGTAAICPGTPLQAYLWKCDGTSRNEHRCCSAQGGEESVGGSPFFYGRACFVFIVLGGGRGQNYFYSKPYVEHQQMHILWSWACCKRDYNAGNL